MNNYSFRLAWALAGSDTKSKCQNRQNSLLSYAHSSHITTSIPSMKLPLFGWSCKSWKNILPQLKETAQINIPINHNLARLLSLNSYPKADNNRGSSQSQKLSSLKRGRKALRIAVKFSRAGSWERKRRKRWQDKRDRGSNSKLLGRPWSHRGTNRIISTRRECNSRRIENWAAKSCSNSTIPFRPGKECSHRQIKQSYSTNSTIKGKAIPTATISHLMTTHFKESISYLTQLKPSCEPKTRRWTVKSTKCCNPANWAKSSDPSSREVVHFGKRY